MVMLIAKVYEAWIINSDVDMGLIVMINRNIANYVDRA